MSYTDFRYNNLAVVDLISTLQRVEINPTELCNRTCVFCPRSRPDMYKNQKLHMSIDTCELIGQQLQNINYSGTIGFVGFGEPMLHPNLITCIETVRKYTNVPIEVNTNGDFLTKQTAKDLINSGCTNITVSMYDSDQSEHFQSICGDLDVTLTLRHHYNATAEYNLNIVNRIAIVDKNAQVETITRPCYMPFYKMFIDWNGDYLLCDQDWPRASAGQYNIHQITIKDFWLDKINSYRRPLIDGDRSVNAPCNKCDINGTVRGVDSFNLIKDYLTHSA